MMPLLVIIEPADLRDRIRQLRLPAAPAALAMLARTDPGFLPVLLDFPEQGRPDDGLSAPDCGLIDVAPFACFTGRVPLARRRRIHVAIEHRRSTREMLQAIQLGTHLAMHGTAPGASVLEELAGEGSARSGRAGPRFRQLRFRYRASTRSRFSRDSRSSQKMPAI